MSKLVLNGAVTLAEFPGFPASPRTPQQLSSSQGRILRTITPCQEDGARPEKHFAHSPSVWHHRHEKREKPTRAGSEGAPPGGGSGVGLSLCSV